MPIFIVCKDGCNCEKLYSDKNLSVNEKAILGYLLSKSDKSSVNISDINKSFYHERKSIFKYIRSLMRKGYICKSDKYDTYFVFYNSPDKKEDKKEKIVVKKKDKVDYYEYIKSEKWKMLRNLCLVEYEYTCQLCNRKPKKLNQLHVHHKDYSNLGNETIKDLILLCDKCHNKFHGNKKSSR